MVVYCKASTSDKDELIDFINMVFSQKQYPHDFLGLLPKLYDCDIDTMQNHYLIKEDGRIKSVIGLYPNEFYVSKHILKLGHIGQVSVHPYRRGLNYMKKLMKKVIIDATEQQFDALVLSGQRNLYESFGFEPTETCVNFTFCKPNVKYYCKDINALGINFYQIKSANSSYLEQMYSIYQRKKVKIYRNKNLFYKILQSWYSQIFAIIYNENLVGYFCSDNTHTELLELVLEDISLFPPFLKKYFSLFKLTELAYQCESYDIDKIVFLSKFCEKYTISTGHNWNILNFETCIRAMMHAKNDITPLEDGHFVIKILNSDNTSQINSTYILDVTSGHISVKQTPKDTVVAPNCIINKLDAISLLFSQTGTFLFPNFTYKNWFPFPLYINPIDSY